MAYPAFPDICPPQTPLKDPLYKPKVRTEFENGTVQSRPRFTRAKKKFVLKWEKISREDRETLEAFFDAIGADVFVYTHPVTGRQYNCIISDDTFDGAYTEGDLSDVTLNIEEI